MGLRFSKMHGLGNDFVVLDGRSRALNLDTATIRAIADRHTGVGCDQLICIEPARDGRSAFYYGLWNADGSAAGQCGNGVRCVAAWLQRDGSLDASATVSLQGPGGTVNARLLADGQVAVDMGEPQFGPARVPFVAAGDALEHAIDVDGTGLAIGAVSMGNPHAVLVLPTLDLPALARLGPALGGHGRFPDGANAGFVQIRARDHLQLRVYERGAGWTRACGTGACAAVAVLHRRGEVDDRVQVDLPGGRLDIEWPGPGHPLWMTGPAAFAFEGEWPRVD